MHAIVLAAGQGSRLRPLTATKPKPMIRVANKPILQYCLEALVANGVRDVTLVVGYQRERVQSFFEDGKKFGVNIDYVFQDSLIGTGHALAQVPRIADAALVLGADNIVDATLVKDVLNAPGPVALAATLTENPSKYGVVTTEGDRVTRIEEHPRDAKANLVNTGVYRVDREFHEYLAKQVEVGTTGLTDVLQRAIEEEGRDVRAVRSRGLWMDAIYPWDVLALAERLVQDAPAEPVAGVHPTAVLEGPHTVGPDGSIGPNVVVGPTTTIGSNVTIGAGSVIENSVIYDDVQIGPGSVIRNTVIGEGTRIDARFTALSGQADVKVRDGWHDLHDFGSIIGEDCHVEGNVTLKPGTLVGNRVRVAAGTVVDRNVDDGTLVI